MAASRIRAPITNPNTMLILLCFFEGGGIVIRHVEDRERGLVQRQNRTIEAILELVFGVCGVDSESTAMAIGQIG